MLSTRFIASVLVTIAAMWSGLSAEHTDLLLEASPVEATVNVTEDVNIDCRPGKSLVDDSILNLLVNIVKVRLGEKTFVARQAGETTDDNGRVKATGHIHKTDADDDIPTYLNVTIKNPTSSDEGVYTCRYVYMNSKYELVSISESVNITVQVQATPQPPTEPPVEPAPVPLAPLEVESGNCTCEEVREEIESLKETLVQENTLLRKEVEKYNESCRVSFSAKMSKDAMLFDGFLAKFDDVISNKGGAFNTKTSTFIAPCPAQYFFSLTLRSQQMMDSGHVTGLLMVDGQEVARTAVFIDQQIVNYQSASNGAVVTLAQGQKVNVKVTTSSAGKLKGSTYSVLSGFYLYP